MGLIPYESADLYDVYRRLASHWPPPLTWKKWCKLTETEQDDYLEGRTGKKVIKYSHVEGSKEVSQKVSFSPYSVITKDSFKGMCEGEIVLTRAKTYLFYQNVCGQGIINWLLCKIRLKRTNKT